MSKQIYANFATSTLAASINNTDLTIQVAAGQGGRFPSPSGGDFFLVTLVNSLGDREHVRVTARSGDLLTVPTGGRGQEGTAAQSWTNGQTRVEMRVTRGTLERFIQRGGDTMSGDLNMGGNDLIDPVISGSGAKFLGGEIVGTPLRGTSGDTSNEIVVPANGTRAIASGQPILTNADIPTTIRAGVFAAGMITLWFGAENAVPAGWAICNGQNGTPDMRGLVPVGAGSAFPYNTTGGAANSTSGSAGSHTHLGSTTDAHALTVEQLPSHGHALHVTNTNTSTNADGWTRFGTRGIPGEDVGPFGYRTASDSGDVLVQATGGGQGHSHGLSGLSSAGAHTHDVPTMPPYRALHFIMKLP